MFSKKATKIDKIFTVDLMFTKYYQIDGDDFVNFCGLLRKQKLCYFGGDFLQLKSKSNRNDVMLL